MPEGEWIAFELSGGDLVKAGFVKKKKMKEIYNYLYLKREGELNRLLILISNYERIKCG